MPQYRVEMGIRDDFVVFVEAEDEMEASEIASEIDVRDWTLRNSETSYFDVYKESE